MPPTADPDAVPQRHAWTVVDFLVIDGRPMMEQRCECGTARTIPAWDRTWTPSMPDEQAERVGATGHRQVVAWANIT